MFEAILLVSMLTAMLLLLRAIRAAEKTKDKKNLGLFSYKENGFDQSGQKPEAKRKK